MFASAHTHYTLPPPTQQQERTTLFVLRWIFGNTFFQCLVHRRRVRKWSNSVPFFLNNFDKREFDYFYPNKNEKWNCCGRWEWQRTYWTFGFNVAKYGGTSSSSSSSGSLLAIRHHPSAVASSSCSATNGERCRSSASFGNVCTSFAHSEWEERISRAWTRYRLVFLIKIEILNWIQFVKWRK